MDAILITGPTASGKSALAVDMAERHGGEVVNADSMQVYDTLHVLTARPFESEMAGIPHHLYGTVAAQRKYSSGEWFRSAEKTIGDILTRSKIPVFVGGTGLYFKALTGGLSRMPDIPADIRDRWRGRLTAEGPQEVHRELQRVDPRAAAILNAGDGQRVVRALEVMEASGRSILEFQQMSGTALVEEDRALKIIVLPDRKALHARINRRFERMLDLGAVEEVAALLALALDAEMPVMKAIGVPQIADMLRGRLTKAEVVELASAATRQYAKRQMTWFRNQMDSRWERLE